MRSGRMTPNKACIAPLVATSMLIQQRDEEKSGRMTPNEAWISPLVAVSTLQQQRDEEITAKDE